MTGTSNRPKQPKNCSPRRHQPTRRLPLPTPPCWTRCAGAVSPSNTDAPVTRNRRTALRRFMESVGKRETHLVENELSDGFLAALARYQVWEQQRGTAASTVRSRCSHLRHVQRIAAKHAGTAPSFAALLDRAITESGRSLAWLEQRSGIGALSLSQWRRGIATPGRLRKLLPQLETSLGLKPGTLLDALPIRATSPTGYGAAKPAGTTDFRKRLRTRAAERPFSLPDADEQLRDEWRQLLEFKTAELPRLRRERRAQWRAKPARMCKPLRPAWCCTLRDGRVSPSAQAAWVQLRQYLGWLRLDGRQGGGGLTAAQAQTLARLADAERVVAFIHWRAERAGGLNTGAVTFLHTVNSLLHPRGGWLTQSPWLAEAAPDLLTDSASWASHCTRTFERLKTFTATVAQSARPTRDVEEALRPLLDTGNPIAVLHDMLERMEADMPAATQPVLRAIHQRDIALVTLLMANPMRIGQLCALEVGAGSDQNLLRLASGWRLQCSGERFKNGTTTMAKGLRVDLDESVNRALDRYMCEGRDVLLAGRASVFFFVGRWRWDPTRSCENLEDRLQLLTERYIPGCDGFRGHGWRHLLATAWLMEHPEDYGTVADLLGDRVETVAKASSRPRQSCATSSSRRW